MTEREAIDIAARKARQLNMPWGPDVVATRLGFWPLPRNWRVVCRAPAELSETTILVNDRSGDAFPHQVHVAGRDEEAAPPPPEVSPQIEVAAPAAPVVARQGLRDVTFMIPCQVCEYKTTVTVTIGVDGRVWSGDGISHEFRCQNCGRSFYVGNDVLRQDIERFV